MNRFDLARVAPLVRRRIRLTKRGNVYDAGNPVQSVYAVRAGMLKTVFTSSNGRDKVVGFHVPGELVGLESLGSDSYLVSAVALADTSLCEIPADVLKSRASDIAALQQRLIEAYGESARRERELMAMLVLMSAEERVSAFLLEISRRLAPMACAESEFLLRMTRADIGSYLGVQLETVSRVLTRLSSAGIIAVRARHVAILDRAELQRVANGRGTHKAQVQVVTRPIRLAA